MRIAVVGGTGTVRAQLTAGCHALGQWLTVLPENVHEEQKRFLLTPLSPAD